MPVKMQSSAAARMEAARRASAGGSSLQVKTPQRWSKGISESLARNEGCAFW